VRSYKIRGAYNLILPAGPVPPEPTAWCGASAGQSRAGRGLRLRPPRRAGPDLPAAHHAPTETRPVWRSSAATWWRCGSSATPTTDAAKAAAEDTGQTGATLVPAFRRSPDRGRPGHRGLRELVSQLGRAPTLLVVPVGGGGLLAGTLVYLRERHPEVRVAWRGAGRGGVHGRRAGRRSPGGTWRRGNPFVDGAAVRRAGEVTYPITRDGVQSRRVPP